MAKKKASDIGALLLIFIGGIVWVLVQYGRELLILAGVVLAVWIGFKLFGSKTQPTVSVPPLRAGAPPARSPDPVATQLVEPIPVIRALKTNGDDFWTETTLGGRRLGGWIYSGKNLAAASGRGVEPSLVDLSLPIDRAVHDCRERRLNYWPAYAAASPQARAAYLHWLTTGRQDPQADIGYVFLYFYGLERRVLHDAELSPMAKSEGPAIKQELERLYAIYQSNHSFQQYAGSLLDLLNFRSVADGLYEREPQPLINGRELSFGHRIALAQCARDGKPLPASWAHTWFLSSPLSYLRTAAIRSPNEFKKLYLWLYGEMFGNGIVLPQNQTLLKLERRPASPTFGGGNTTHTLQFKLPDVTVLTSPVKQLQEVADACDARLQAYSRIVAKNQAMANAFEAIVELPPMLWPPEMRKPIEQVRELVERAGKPLVLPFAKLHGWFPDWQLVNRQKLTALCRALGEAGLGMEPDLRFGGALPSNSSTVVLFADDKVSAQATASTRYSAAALMLHLATTVASADGKSAEEEKAVLKHQLEDSLQLTESERRRLHARLRLLLQEPPKLTGLKSRVDALDRAQREVIGDFLALVALADGHVTPGEIAAIERTYKLLGLDPKSVYSKVHVAATEPVTIKRRSGGDTEYAIPKPPAAASRGDILLDPAKIANLQADSERVAAILSSIFAQAVPAPEPEVSATTLELETMQTHHAALMGLDDGDSALVRTLLTRAHWARAELDEMAIDRGLMLDGALERLNDAAFEKFDKALLEGTDPVDINPDVAHELMQ